MNAIIANDLTKKYGSIAALRGLNLEIPEATVCGVLGKSGSGKTSLIKLLCGFVLPDFGSCAVMGLSPGTDGERVRAITGVLMDSAKLYDSMSVADNIAFFGKLSGMSGAEARDRASMLMHDFGIWGMRNSIVSKITTNEIKLASVCRALISSPKVLLLDDCFTGFDSVLVEETAKALKTKAAEEGVTILVTADAPNGDNLCDSYLILRDGAVAAKGNTDSLIKHSGLKRKAFLRTSDGKLSLALDGFIKDETGAFVKNIEKEEDMADIISRSVYLGNKLIEAKMQSPGIDEIFESFSETEDVDE